RPDGSGGSPPQRMSDARPGPAGARRDRSRMSAVALLASEIRESFAIAVDSIRAHKLRSGLTLLGVLVGVFSIVVVMTALRVLQSNIESSLSQLGANTFAVQRFPAVRVEHD